MTTAPHICATWSVPSTEILESPSSTPAQHPLYLVVIGGGIPGAMIRLSSGGNSARPGSRQHLANSRISSISRYHAFLGVDEEGRVRLSDLGSTNGTFINERRIPEQTPILIDDGDRLQFGANVVFKFIRPDPCDEQFQREMFERTVRDSLTGLYNRAYFMAQFGALADRSGLKGLGVGAPDARHRPLQTDQRPVWPRQVGDAVLREVSNVLRQATRVRRPGRPDTAVRSSSLPCPSPPPTPRTERAERMRLIAVVEADAGDAGRPAPVSPRASAWRSPRRIDPGRSPRSWPPPTEVCTRPRTRGGTGPCSATRSQPG